MTSTPISLNQVKMLIELTKKTRVFLPVFTIKQVIIIKTLSYVILSQF